MIGASSETDGVTTTNGYNADEELTTSATGTAGISYGYNADGDQTSAGTNAYTYDGAGDLTGTDTSAGNFTYAYDSGGNLTSASLDGTKIAGTVWDLNNPLPMAAEDTNAAGSTTADYVWNPGGTLASMTTPGGTDYAVSDWLGSITGLVNSSGTQATSTTYGAYGTPSTTDLAGAAPSPSIGYAASYALLGGGGLDDMRARDYNPGSATFTSVDPALGQTGQPYAYADDDPIGASDPSGRKTWGLCLSGAGVAGPVGSLCLQVSFDPFTGEVQLGSAQAGGFGAGVPSLSAGIGFQESNATQISQLGGPFGYGAGSIVIIGAEGFTGSDACNNQISGGTISLGATLAIDPLPDWETHGGITWTHTNTWASFNLYNAASDVISAGESALSSLGGHVVSWLGILSPGSAIGLSHFDPCGIRITFRSFLTCPLKRFFNGSPTG